MTDAVWTSLRTQVSAMGSRVMIGAGAKILGNVKIGDGAKIGAGSVVLVRGPAPHHRGRRPGTGGGSPTQRSSCPGHGPGSRSRRLRKVAQEALTDEVDAFTFEGSCCSSLSLAAPVAPLPAAVALY